MPSWFLRSTGLLRLAPASAASPLARLLGLLALVLASGALLSPWKRRLMSALMPARLLLRRLLRPLRVLSRRTALAVLGRSRDWAPGTGLVLVFETSSLLLFLFSPSSAPAQLLAQVNGVSWLLRGRSPLAPCPVLPSTGMTGTKDAKILAPASGLHYSRNLRRRRLLLALPLPSQLPLSATGSGIVLTGATGREAAGAAAALASLARLLLQLLTPAPPAAGPHRFATVLLASSQSWILAGCRRWGPKCVSYWTLCLIV